MRADTGLLLGAAQAAAEAAVFWGLGASVSGLTEGACFVIKRPTRLSSMGKLHRNAARPDPERTLLGRNHPQTKMRRQRLPGCWPLTQIILHLIGLALAITALVLVERIRVWEGEREGSQYHSDVIFPHPFVSYLSLELFSPKTKRRRRLLMACTAHLVYPA